MASRRAWLVLAAALLVTVPGGCARGDEGDVARTVSSEPAAGIPTGAGGGQQAPSEGGGQGGAQGAASQGGAQGGASQGGGSAGGGSAGGGSAGGGSAGGGSAGGAPGAPVNQGAGGAALPAPVAIPDFTVDGADFLEQRAFIEDSLIEACGDGTLCVEVGMDLVDEPGAEACTILLPLPSGTVSRGSTVTFRVAAPCPPDPPEPGTEPPATGNPGIGTSGTEAPTTSALGTETSTTGAS